VKDLDAAELSLQSVTDMLLHYILRTGAVKQLASFNTNHQVFCSFGGINLKRYFTVIYGLNLAQCVCTGYIKN